MRRTLLLPSLGTEFGEQATNLAWSRGAHLDAAPAADGNIDYVTQRTESMMGLFYLLTIYCSVRALDRQPGRWHAAADPRVRGRDGLQGIDGHGASDRRALRLGVRRRARCCRRFAVRRLYVGLVHDVGAARRSS